MGVPLLTRSSRGVELTGYGETLYQNGRLMRRLYDNTLKAIANQRGRTEQGLSIGSGYSWWTLFIRDMVVDIRQFPSARIHVSLGNQLRCMDQLLSGDISLFVAHEIEGLNRSTGARFIPLTRVGQGYFVARGPSPARARRAPSAKSSLSGRHQSSLPEIRHQRFFEAWSRTTAGSAPFDQGKYAFASNSLAACLDYVERSDAVIGHTEVMADEFVRRGLRKCP